METPDALAALHSAESEEASEAPRRMTSSEVGGVVNRETVLPSKGGSVADRSLCSLVIAFHR